MLAFTLLTAILFHGFWSAAADQAMTQQINLVKNLAIMGGLVFIFVYDRGRSASITSGGVPPQSARFIQPCSGIGFIPD
ncbi:MAG: hypothetical protein ABI612_22970 [Betaproteobacteria bacterium]